MTDYEILLDYKRMTEERQRLLKRLDGMSSERIFTRTRYGKICYYIKTESDGTFHEHLIDREKYVKLLDTNYYIRETRSKLLILDNRIRKLSPRIHVYEDNIRTLFNKQQQFTDKILQNCMPMKNSYLYLPDDLIYHTQRGELVRSKSESFIADKMHENGIFYKYEPEFSGTGYHPDFFIRDNIRQIPIIWEHFGKMDNPEYVHDYLKKLETYRKFGFYPEYNLITTFEFFQDAYGKKIVFDAHMAESVIKKWFLPEGVIIH